MITTITITTTVTKSIIIIIIIISKMYKKAKNKLVRSPRENGVG